MWKVIFEQTKKYNVLSCSNEYVRQTLYFSSFNRVYTLESTKKDNTNRGMIRELNSNHVKCNWWGLRRVIPLYILQHIPLYLCCSISTLWRTVVSETYRSYFYENPVHKYPLITKRFRDIIFVFIDISLGTFHISWYSSRQ